MKKTVEAKIAQAQAAQATQDLLKLDPFAPVVILHAPDTDGSDPEILLEEGEPKVFEHLQAAKRYVSTMIDPSMWPHIYYANEQQKRHRSLLN